ncbi:MAG: cyclase family protein [Archangium sp.]|nr:cyclase family protein [Archangium sp.]MDP3151900.1 cyclase family protein [Archangium sp.]MDP3571313.1 cyclase family protein [Archangium sp.]
MPHQTPQWIDISVPVRTGMAAWPGNPPVVLERTLDLARGDDANVSSLSLGVHSGTHMDAPVHFAPNAAGIDAMPLDVTIGPARVVVIEDPSVVTEAELLRCQLQRGERVLLKTRNSARLWKTDTFIEDFVFLSLAAAQLLARTGVRCVGIDALSVAGYEHDHAHSTHRALLDAGVWIIEGLDLSGVEAGRYDLVCLPLRLEGADGAPARAAVRRRTSGAP